MGRRSKQRVEDMAEELCFVCKDGGDIRVCDFKNCLKGYHSQCVGKEESFLDSDDQFICDLHKCVSCKRNSDYHCLCCPSSSVCCECLGKVEFAQFRKQSQIKGLCNNCLKLALFVEKNSEANSDGIPETVEFRHTENYLVLFKDYWEAIKDNEGLALIDLQRASICLRTSLSCKQGRDSEKPPDEDYRADKNSLSVNDDTEQPFLVDVKVQPSEAKVSPKRKKSNKKTYVGWGSKELIEFLSCIGKDTTKPLDEFILTGVVKEYIQQRNLFKDRKRKSVICDDKLHSLFRKRKVKSNMILNLLEIHLAVNAASEDDFLDDSEDEGRNMRKKPCNTLKAAETSERDPKRNKKCFAALNHNNLKLIYLRRTLIMNLLGQDTFEQKVVGSLVRVKNDDNHYSYQMPKKHYQLGLVTGIRKSSQEYKIKDKHTDILLCVSNLWDDIKISMLSEEDIEEDECNDLLMLAKKGLFKRPTVADLEEKAASIHVDIVNHWIDRELMRLEKEIERAHEKGWRQELHELFNKKRLLSTQEERQRRLAEVPEVIPDTEEESKRDEFGVAASNHLEENKGATGHVPDSVKVLMEDSRGATGHIADSVKVLMEGLPGDASGQVTDYLEVVEEETPEDASGQVADILEVVKEEIPEDASGQVADILEVVEEETPEDASGQVAGILEVVEEETPEDGGTAQGGDMGNGRNTSRHLNDRKSVIVIDSDSDEDEDPHPEQHEPERAAPGAAMDVVMAPTHSAPVAMNGTSAPTRRCAKRGKNGTTTPIGRVPTIAALHALQAMNPPGEHEYIWNYTDPQGEVQGPFTMGHMRQWHRDRFFPPDFRVWRLGQTQEDSILLTEAMGLKFSS